jgi:hypothetical protein
MRCAEQKERFVEVGRTAMMGRVADAECIVNKERVASYECTAVLE